MSGPPDYNPTFRVKVEIMRNSDGVARSREELYEDRGHADFMYGDGNYSCDCNRGLFFARWGDEEDPEHGCSTREGELYSVRLIDVVTGDEFYADGRFDE